MKRICFVTFIFYTLLLFTYLKSSPSSSLISTLYRLREDIYRVDSLNMNLIGMWNFGYPCAIYAKDNYLYLGSGGCVIIFDVSDTTNPEKIGYISFPGAFVRDIYILGTLMFVANREKGLRIADISDPVNPIEIGADDSTMAHAVFAKNQLAYITGQSDTIWTLVIYNVSNPWEPNILGKVTLPKAQALDVIVKDEYAYIADGQAGGLRIIDVSDSTNPMEIGHFIPPGSAYSLAICCDTILLLSTETVPSHSGGLWLINIKDPYNPYPMGCDTSFLEGMDVSYFSHYAYVSSVLDGIKIIDFIDPSTPHIVGEFLPPYDPLNIVNANIGPFIYAGEWWGNALRTIDASDPTQPVMIDHDLIPDQSKDISVQGDYAYIANFHSGVYILDVSDPSKPKDISYYDTPGRSNSIIVRDSIAYVADESSIILLNIKNAFYPEKISELTLACDGYGIALNFPYLYVTSEWCEHQFAIVDVNNPQNPSITGTCYFGNTYYPTYICYKDSFAFVSASYGLAVINTADVCNPILVTYLSLPGYARGIGYSGDYIYVATEETFICIIDISDPTTPILVDSFYTIMDYPFALSISDSLLYVAFQFAGIEAFNISSPLSPQSVGHYIGRPLCSPIGITVENGLAYLTADNGIYIFQYTGGAGKKEEVEKRESKTNISFQCYPSTFSKKVSIEVNAKKEENIKLELYDVAGRKIKDIFDGKIKGKGLFSWNGLNNNEREISSGIYFARLTSSNFTYVNKVILVR